MSARLVRLAFTVTMTVRSPFLFKGLAARLMGLDASALRDERGRAIIPADQLRGTLRDAFEDLAASGAGLPPDVLRMLFGSASANEDSVGAANLPDRTLLFIEDLVASGESARAPLEMTRVAINDDSGAADHGKLQVLELVAKSGDNVTFTGQIVAFLPESQAQDFETNLRNALQLIRSIGSAKTAGLGRVVGSRVTRNAAPSAKALPVSAGGKTWRRYRLIFDRPFLVDSQRYADNAMAGASIMPGAVLKGALARQLVLAGEDVTRQGNRLGEALERLVVGHAFPAEMTTEPDSDVGPFRDAPCRDHLPFSLAATKAEVCDALAMSSVEALLLGDGLGGKDLAVFQSDWKDKHRKVVRKRVGWPESNVPLIPRTHTAITHSGIADEARVFTTLARSAQRKLNGAWEERRWLVDIDWTVVTECYPAETDALLARLTAPGGIEGIGKTQATVRLEATDEAIERLTPFQGDDCFALVLKTPAYLLDMAAGGKDIWADGPEQAYRAYFADHLPGAELIKHYAAQALRGGYVSRRNRIGDKTYYPFLLTLPGSVFLLRASKGVQELLKRFVRTGLPAATIKGVPATWRNCPYVPENGFGHFWPDYVAPRSGGMEVGNG